MTELPPPDARLPEGYYLANVLTVLEDVESRYGDLLLSEETTIIQGFRGSGVQGFRGCSLGAQRLYVRMLTRKGPWFRTDRLEYKEIGDPRPFVGELIREETTFQVCKSGCIAAFIPHDPRKGSHLGYGLHVNPKRRRSKRGLFVRQNVVK